MEVDIDLKTPYSGLCQNVYCSAITDSSTGYCYLCERVRRGECSNTNGCKGFLCMNCSTEIIPAKKQSNLKRFKDLVSSK